MNENKLKYDDRDIKIIEDAIMAKKEMAKQMKENGFDEETITEDVWNKPNQMCQGTCESFLTWEAYNVGLDICFDCKHKSID